MHEALRIEHAKKLGFESVDEMDMFQDAGNKAADPADSLYAEETGIIDPPHPEAELAQFALVNAEKVRMKRLADDARGTPDKNVATAVRYATHLRTGDTKVNKSEAAIQATTYMRNTLGVAVDAETVRKKL